MLKINEIPVYDELIDDVLKELAKQRINEVLSKLHREGYNVDINYNIRIER